MLTVFEAEIGNQEIDLSENPADENITEYRWMKPEKLVQNSDNSNLCNLIERRFDSKDT